MQKLSEVAFHPLADLFPLIEGAEFDALVADVRERGVIMPIMLYEDAILDGRNRYRAAKAAGIVDLPFVDFHGDDPVGFVTSLNLARRHLSESQRAMIAAKLANLDQGRPGKPANLPVSPVTQERAADLLNVSERTVRTARSVRDHGAPELVRAVERGEVPVSAAAQFAKQPVEAQKAAIESAPDTASAVRQFRNSLPNAKQAKRIAAESKPGTFVLGKDGRMHADTTDEERARFEKYLAAVAALRAVSDLRMSAVEIVGLVDAHGAPTFGPLVAEVADLINAVRSLWEKRNAA